MNLTHVMRYTEIKVLNVDILLLTLILSSAFYVAIFVAVFKTPLEWNNSGLIRNVGLILFRTFRE